MPAQYKGRHIFLYLHTMEIRPASTPDLASIMTVLEAAKGIMRASGDERLAYQRIIRTTF